MVKIRHLLATILICLSLTTICALAQSSLTQIRDIITNSDGTPFNGMVVITWNGFSVPNGTPISQLSASARIYNGALSVLLVPTTNTTAGTYYQVVYSSTDGTVSWTETWQVPPSTSALTISQVRQSTTQGGGGTTTGGGQYATLPIAINQVTNLSSDLSSINNAISLLDIQTASQTVSLASVTANLTVLQTTLTSLTNTVNGLVTTVNNLGASGANANFADSEIPAGALNGTNATFTLAGTPSPTSSFTLYRNGLAQSSGIDYTLSGSTVTFLSGSIPKSTDTLQTFYRLPGTGPATTFVDAAVSTGTINGINLVFTLPSAPSPGASLKLYKNGLLLAQPGDYTLNGATITFASQLTAPQTGDALLASYRH